MPLDINISETSGPNVGDFLSPHPNQRYFVPICLNTFMVNRSFLHEYIDELMQKKLNMNIIIGDYLERHNLMFFYGMSEEEALKKVGQKASKIYSIVNEAVGSNCSIQVHSCRDYIDTNKGHYIANNIRRFEEEDAKFLEDMNRQTAYIIDSTLRRSGISKSNFSADRVNRLHSYMVEEITLYMNLYINGFTTEIYPGRDLEILKRIAKGEYRNFPFNYSNRTHISVNLSLDCGRFYARIHQESSFSKVAESKNTDQGSQN